MVIGWSQNTVLCGKGLIPSRLMIFVDNYEFFNINYVFLILN